VKFGRAVFELCERTDRQTDKKQTDRQTDIFITVLRTPQGSEVKTAKQFNKKALG